jgi:hypothetical protein
MIKISKLRVNQLLIAYDNILMDFLSYYAIHLLYLKSLFISIYQNIKFKK